MFLLAGAIGLLLLFLVTVSDSDDVFCPDCNRRPRSERREGGRCYLCDLAAKHPDVKYMMLSII